MFEIDCFCFWSFEVRETLKIRVDEVRSFKEGLNRDSSKQRRTTYITFAWGVTILILMDVIMDSCKPS